MENFEREETMEIFTVEGGALKSKGQHKVKHIAVNSSNTEVEELKQAILECRGLYKGFKIDETTASALAAHLNLIDYRKVWRVEKETAKKIFLELIKAADMAEQHGGACSLDYLKIKARQYGVEVVE